MGFSLGGIRETPERGPFLTLPMAPFKRDLMERVYIPKGLPNPKSYFYGASRKAYMA